MIHEGKIKVTVKGELDGAVEETAKRIFDGFQITKIKSKILWPYFWRRRYKVVLEKGVLLDDETDTMAEFPIKQDF